MVTLLPGDLIYMGTPKGTAIEDGDDAQYMQPGGVLRSEVEKLGVCENVVMSNDDYLARHKL